MTLNVRSSFPTSALISFCRARVSTKIWGEGGRDPIDFGVQPHPQILSSPLLPPSQDPKKGHDNPQTQSQILGSS